jgi:hypothetical protein
LKSSIGCHCQSKIGATLADRRIHGVHIGAVSSSGALETHDSYKSLGDRSVARPIRKDPAVHASLSQIHLSKSTASEKPNPPQRQQTAPSRQPCQARPPKLEGRDSSAAAPAVDERVLDLS